MHDGIPPLAIGNNAVFKRQFGHTRLYTCAWAWVSIEIERPQWWDVVGFFFGLFQRLLELLFEQSIAILHRRHLTLENLFGVQFVAIQILEQCVEILASGWRLTCLAMRHHLARSGIDDEVCIALGTTQGEVTRLGHLEGILQRSDTGRIQAA